MASIAARMDALERKIKPAEEYKFIFSSMYTETGFQEAIDQMTGKVIQVHFVNQERNPVYKDALMFCD